MALTVKEILDMDVTALKTACDEVQLSVKDDRKPALQAALITHYFPTTTTANDTIEQQAPAAHELQSFFRLKPESLAALQDGGYDTVGDITLLAQDPKFIDLGNH